MDHIGIFLLIAGTVTPIGLVVLDGRWRVALVGGIWLLAVPRRVAPPSGANSRSR